MNFRVQAGLDTLRGSIVATRRGVSLETVKTQLKAIYAKTGCSREVELVAGFSDRSGLAS